MCVCVCVCVCVRLCVCVCVRARLRLTNYVRVFVRVYDVRLATTANRCSEFNRTA